MSSASGCRPQAWEEALHWTDFESAPARPFTFAVVTDSHCTETPASIRHSEGLEHAGSGVARLRLCFEAISSLEERPDFVLLLGDIGIDHAETLLREAPCPVHAVAGNHEWGNRRTRLRELYPDDFGEGNEASDYYAFEHHGVQFIGICNAGIGNEHVGQLASEEIRPPGQSGWIRNRVRERSGLKILFGHCPPEPVGFDREAYLRNSSSRYLPFMGENDSQFLLELLRRHPPIVAFFGHTHRGSSTEHVGDSLVRVVRSACWNHGNEAIGFLQVRVGRGEIRLRDIITATYK